MLNELHYRSPYAVEILTFTVRPEEVEHFLEADHEVWTKGLAACEGFVSKDVWVSTRKPGVVMTVIYWKSLELWQAISQERLKELDEQFTTALGGIEYQCAADHELHMPECVRHTDLG